MSISAQLDLVDDCRARWLNVERFAEEHGDGDLCFRAEQAMLSMLATKDRLERLQAEATMLDELEAEVHSGIHEHERHNDPDEVPA